MRKNIVKYPKVNKPSWQSKLVLIYMRFYMLRDLGLKETEISNPKTILVHFISDVCLMLTLLLFIAIINFPKYLKRCIFISLIVIRLFKRRIQFYLVEDGLWSTNYVAITSFCDKCNNENNFHWIGKSRFLPIVLAVTCSWTWGWHSSGTT